MGCSDHSKDLNIKPLSSDTAQNFMSNYNTSSSQNTTTINTQLLHTCTPTNFLALNHHQGNGSDHHHQQSSTEFSEQPLSSSRWNPTPEQLLALEELYRQGTRTPTADQIQQIAAKLRRFGKIEGKNVFYWFQNHKARERQKRRRQVESVSHDQCEIQSLGKKDQVLRRTDYEFEQIESWTAYSNCRKLINEELIPKHGQATEEASTGTTNEQNMKASYYSPIHLTNTITKPAPSHTNSSSCSSLKANYFPNFLEDSESRETQTLELFPLHSSGHNGNINCNKRETKLPITSLINTKLTPSQYFEFLPLKN